MQHVHEVRDRIALVEHVERDDLNLFDQLSFGRRLRAEPAFGELLLDHAPLELGVPVVFGGRGELRGLVGCRGRSRVRDAPYAKAAKARQRPETARKRKAEPAVQVYPRLGYTPTQVGVFEKAQTPRPEPYRGS